MNSKSNLSTTFGLDESTSPSLLQDITLEKSEVGIRNSASSGLTMKEYEEQLKKLTAENFNLKLRVYFVEERLSKVTGINDKEDLIKKNIQLKVNCESQLKELEKKQELLFEASKAFELLQKEHAEEVEKLVKEKDKKIEDLEEKLKKLDAFQQEIKSKFPDVEDFSNTNIDIKRCEEYEEQIRDLEAGLREEEERFKELENLFKDNQIELESYHMKTKRMESEIDQRVLRIEELVSELEQKERDLASANLRIGKLEDELKSKHREDEILKERVEEKNKTIESLKSSLATRYDAIEALENRIAKEKSSLQTMQTKVDALSFQNSRLKEEIEILQSRLRRTTETLSPRGKGRSGEDEILKQKYEELVRTMEDHEAQYMKRIKDLEDSFYEKQSTLSEDYQELVEKHKKLEDDHKKACTALKNFIKRSGEEKREREALNQMLSNHEEVIANLRAQLERYHHNVLTKTGHDDKLSLAETGDDKISGGELRTNKKENGEHVDIHKMKYSIEQAEEPGGLLGKGDFAENVEGVSKLKESETQHALEEKADSNLNIKLNAGEFFCNKKPEINTFKKEGSNSVSKMLTNNSNIAFSSKDFKMNALDICAPETKIVDTVNEMEVRPLNKENQTRDNNLHILHHKLIESGVESNSFALLGCKLSFHIDKSESCNSLTTECPSERNKISTSSRESFIKTETIEKDAAKVCSLLAVRLEELAVFLDSLLRSNEVVSSMSLGKYEGIKEAAEKSRELSRHLSLSFAKKDINDSPCSKSDVENSCELSLWTPLENSAFSESSIGICQSREKILFEQTLIINRLREQLRILNQEIQQRDIELSRCQGLSKKTQSDLEFYVSGGEETEKKTSISQDLSDDLYDEDHEVEKWNIVETKKEETSFIGKICKKSLLFLNGNRPSKTLGSLETSESEGWSEPDRTVSLARMGRLEGQIVNLSNLNCQCEDSSDSSEETLNDNAKNQGKRSRNTEAEVRRLQNKVKALQDTNNRLRSDMSLLTVKPRSHLPLRLQKNEEANLTEKLRKTMERLEECSLTCRELEEKLAAALERASSSAVQLSKAQETISNLESQIISLRDALSAEKLESGEKSNRILELEKIIEEISMESERRIIEASKQREAAENKTFEVECKLKDAENLSMEVQCRLQEIEKKITETKQFKKDTDLQFKEAEKHIDTAEKMMEEAERIKTEAERKSKDFQSFIDLMRKEVEEKMKEAERRVRKSEKEKEELEKQVAKLKKRLMEAEKNKTEVETRVKEGKETIQCMEEKLRELEVAMDQCNDEAQKKIKDMQKKADAKIKDLEIKIEERESVRKMEYEKKMEEAGKISRELEMGFRKQLEDAEKKMKKVKEDADCAVKKIQEDLKIQEEELRQKLVEMEAEKTKECTELRNKLNEVRLQASEFELELTRLTNEKIHLEEELKKVLNKESALEKDNQEIRGKYEASIQELENKLTQLTMNKSQLASRLEEIESTNIDLVTRISAIRGKETMIMEQEFTTTTSPIFSPSRRSSPLSSFFGDLEINGDSFFGRQGSAASDPGEATFGVRSSEAFFPPRRNMNSSPDLGIESDPGRFSSLEAPQICGDQIGISEFVECNEVKKLEYENAELKRRLVRTRQALEETLMQLSAANQRKKQVEKAICKQLHKTHHILRKAQVNFETQEGDLLQ